MRISHDGSIDPSTATHKHDRTERPPNHRGGSDRQTDRQPNQHQKSPRTHLFRWNSMPVKVMFEPTSLMHPPDEACVA
jgi:hypothetical protein